MVLIMALLMGTVFLFSSGYNKYYPSQSLFPSLSEIKQLAVVVYPFVFGVFIIAIVIEHILNKKDD